MTLPRRRFLPVMVFALLATVPYAAGVVIVRLPEFAISPSAMATALSLDLTLGVVLVAWLFLIRWAGLPPLTLVPVFLASIVLAGQVLPAGQQGMLGGLGLAAQAAELAVIAYGVIKVFRIGRRTASSTATATDGDLLVAAHDAVAVELGTRAASILASEIGVFAYGLGGWFRRPRAPAGALAFGYLDAWKPMLGAIAVILAVETVGIHLLVRLASPVAALALTVLSLYGLFWLLADAQAARHRPILVTTDVLLVRIGLRWTARVPRRLIVKVHRPDLRAGGRLPDRLLAAMDGQPNVEVWLSEPVVARGPFGIERSVTRLAIGLDEPAAFMAALELATPVP